MLFQQRVGDSTLQGTAVTGVATPPELSALYRDLMSPYCPGLSLASCPSPQADSLRDAIAARFGQGESPSEITSALVVDYGPGIRGSPALEGFGAVAFVVPVLLLVGGALFAQRWLRRHTRKASA
jgi:cytochrome c-type biogenesis protein CcmH/NrfF